MENKVLIKLFILGVDESFDLYIPVNEVMWKIRQLVIKAISDILNIRLTGEFALINKDTCKMYGNNEIIIDTDIRNASELILVSINKEVNNITRPVGRANDPFLSNQIPKNSDDLKETVKEPIKENTFL